MDRFERMSEFDKFNHLKNKVDEIEHRMGLAAPKVNQATRPVTADTYNQAGSAGGQSADMYNEAKSAGLNPVHQPSPEELQKREHGSRDKLVNAVQSFCETPSQERFQLVQLLIIEYQTTWMQGRKRVSVHD